ncbi:hypothetical protein PV08_05015 [Exophiala spinifera]|uniref:Transcription factor domain-containing protein n=1 Tax=Exophiala spinifera TaxID=91928 RepID=A0A0D2BGR3_9EURO|nr:uncharacterized protein PV08_05015 [Exophiala spinifera]KIW17820.1 hypothetical protein PV08_05015 [Exophiala spinifera]
MQHSKLARPVVSSYERRQDPLSACGTLAPDAREAIADQEGGFKLPLTLPGWQVGGSNPPSLGQAEFHKLVSIMEAYTTFLSKPLTLLRAANSTRAMDRASKLKATFEQNSFDELTLFTTRLVNLGHLTAIKFLRENVPVCACAKAKALHQIQRWIQGTGALPPSNLISAVLLLIRGDRAVRVHLNGLSRLVDLHYGPTNLEHNMDPIASAIISCDLILAACSPGAVPSFVSMERPALTRASGAQDAVYYRSSPLMLSESFSALRRIYVDVPDSLTDLLTACFLATRDHVTPDDPYSLPDELDYSAATARVELPPVVFEACRLAAAIYLRTTTRRTSFDGADNQGDSRQLGALLHSQDISCWRGIPYIYLWILLTGAAAAQGHPERQYFMAELVRFGFSVGLEQMEDFKSKFD